MPRTLHRSLEQSVEMGPISLRFVDPRLERVSYGILNDAVKELWLSDSFLVSIAVIGMAAGYGLERTTRLVFLRERQLDLARRRADDLLRNTLPGSVVDRLQAGDTAPEEAQIADRLESVTVLFADLVRFTEHASRVAPHELVVVLDDVFTRFDELADRVGMEKIKTVGDSYMAVAGAPDPGPDHAGAAAEMALGVLACLKGARWPTGEPMDVRVGVASGPVVAGVIGRRKFAYDLWGDTVNVASRLESRGEPGQDPGVGADVQAVDRQVRVQRALHRRAEGEGSDAGAVPAGTCRRPSLDGVGPGAAGMSSRSSRSRSGPARRLARGSTAR
ncbi:MAG: adenylate/guanylate cyclase domain-containing protein [Actinomycetota bacterium]